MSIRKILPCIAAFMALARAPAALAHESMHGEAGNAVTRWNGIALQVLPADPGLILDSRALAILHAAIHDAVNGVDRRYQPYTAALSSPNASVDAAIAAASHDVLIALSPSQQGTIEVAYASALLEIADGPAKQSGIELGRASAKANLERRIGDGADTAAGPAYVPNGKPGDYDFTPPFDGTLGKVALFPGFGNVTPFGIVAGSHGLPGPDRLDSAEYTKDFNQLKAIGALDSKIRTREQTDIARFWFEGSPTGWNRIANSLIRQQKLDVWRSARVMALVNFALTDGYIAGFDAKYHFRFWRPVTAIRRADTDGNPYTKADPTWLPMEGPGFFTPPLPDYPSTHTVLGAAAAEVLIQNLGDHVHFTVSSGTLPGALREFDNISDAALENGLSRIYGGVHFLHAVRDGCRQGKGIGQDISQLLPRVGDRAESGADGSAARKDRLCEQFL